MSVVTAAPSRYPRHMRHSRSYARNNDPRALDHDLARDPHARDRWVDLDQHCFRFAEDGPEPWHRKGQWVLICLHWLTPARNGFRYIEYPITGHIRRLTAHELNDNMRDWPAEKVLALRFDRRGGYRPMTLFEALDICARHGAAANPESKAGTPTTRVMPWRRAAAHARQLNVRLVMKTLPAAGWKRRCYASRRGGVAAVLIAGGLNWGRRPWRVRRPPYIAAVWGPSAWRH